MKNNKIEIILGLGEYFKNSLLSKRYISTNQEKIIRKGIIVGLDSPSPTPLTAFIFLTTV